MTTQLQLINIIIIIIIIIIITSMQKYLMNQPISQLRDNIHFTKKQVKVD